MPHHAAFRSDKFYLSNMYPCPVWLWGCRFPSTEHAFVYAKLDGDDWKAGVHRIKTPKAVKKYGQEGPIRPDWHNIQLTVMEKILRAKFNQHPDLARKLILEEGELIEYNYWKDDFWGVCTDAGQNHLGKLLMKIREELKTKGVPITIWDYWNDGAWVVIPTNMQTKRDGSAVMGAGIALQAANKFPELPTLYGDALAKSRGFYINRDMRVICVPTKVHWREKSDLDLIRIAVTALKKLPEVVTPVAVPALGCGRGGLSWNSVKPILERLDPARFIIVEPLDDSPWRRVNETQ